MTSPFGPVQSGMVQDRSSDKNRVIDLSTFRATKTRTGEGLRVAPSSPDSPSMTRHEDEALAIHNEPKKPRTLKNDVKKAYTATTKFLGLDEESNK